MLLLVPPGNGNKLRYSFKVLVLHTRYVMSGAVCMACSA